MADSGTIDITVLVQSLQSTFVSWGTTFVYGLLCAIPYGIGAIFAFPPVGIICKAIIHYILNLISTSLEMEAFFLNTAIRKASQAQDYQDAVNARQMADADSETTYDQFVKIEQAEIDAFSNFVRVSN